MKIHYINILLFALPLNILVHNQRNHKKTILHTPKTKSTRTHRSLCECELYAPVNYYSDPQMKEVMDNFNKQTQQRFHEYDERMKTTRQKCKDRCDKDIQKIILKDKIEKELAETFSSLHTDIQSDAIPTCICEKSLADKVEKGCLRCAQNLGGLVPGMGLIGGTAVYAAAVKAATKAGMKEALEGLKSIGGLKLLLQDKFTELVTTRNFQCPNALVGAVQNVINTQCVGPAAKNQLLCNGYEAQNDSRIIQKAVDAGRDGADVYIRTFSDSTTITTFLTDPIVISAIVVISIVVILLIIYLILRYRRLSQIQVGISSIVI
ncbi:hypothetical protein PFNF54_02417 [Plasmodium falciparum NF54]|uniref:Rifin n=1 Tax=Plasmodium falciparum (isolate NF54) TaxID=5843 RepID=W7KG52_PLAFO|nr:hypothetical protein PFNF54_02417 [Plasmodium falciparum NF54]